MAFTLLLCLGAVSCRDRSAPDSLAPMKPHVVARTPSNLVLDISNAGRLKFQAASRRIMLDNILIYCNTEVTAKHGKWKLAAIDETLVVRPLLLRETCTTAPNPIILIDPGHGGNDTGAIVPGKIVEKTIALDIALRTKAALEAVGCRVRLTRSDDSTLTLLQRSAIAASCNADLFVSVHINSSKNPDASGIETFTLPAPGYPSTSNSGRGSIAVPANRFDAASNILAYRVHAAMVHANRMIDRGVKRARFVVLENAPCPAILVECGFATNNSDLQLLTVPDSRAKLALSLAQGILAAIPAPPPPITPSPKTE